MTVANSAQSRLSAPGHGFGGSVKVSYGECAFSGTITTADTATICNLPLGAIVLGATIEADDLDTNGTPTITLNVGDSGSATRYFSGSTVAQAGTVAVSAATTGIFSTVATGQTAVLVAVAANSATSAAGNVRLVVTYYLP